MLFQRFTLRIISLFLIFLSPASHGKLFRSSYIEFKIEYDWQCKSFGIDWVCYHYFEKKDRPAFILITAQEGLKTDDENLYKSLFNTKPPVSARKIHIKTVLINRKNWIEGFFQNIISKNMFSRYMATVCCKDTSEKIRIVVGFHAYKDNYTKYSNEFLRSIKSLRLAKDVKKTLKQIKRQNTRQKTAMLTYIQKILSETDEAIPYKQRQQTSSSSFPMVLWFVILFAMAIGLYYFLYASKKAQRRRRLKRRKRRHGR